MRRLDTADAVRLITLDAFHIQQDIPPGGVSQAALRKEKVENLPSKSDSGFWKEFITCKDTNGIIEIELDHNKTILPVKLMRVIRFIAIRNV